MKSASRRLDAIAARLLLGAALMLPVFAMGEESAAGASDKPSDAEALRGVEVGRVAWDINMGDPAKLALYFRVMEETYDDLKRQGVKPDMVFTFRGPSVTLISADRTDVPLDQEAHYQAIAESVANLLAKPGVRMEACSIAARLMKVDTGALLPGVEPVGNTFVSQIGYQSKGYATIPIF